MSSEVLLMDGVRYEPWTPPDEDTLAEEVKKHSKDILGKESVYLDIRKLVRGGSVAAIPDAYAITFDPDQWWVVEVELSSHPVYDHIVNQLGRFSNGVSSPQTQRDLTEAFYSYVGAEPLVKADLSQKRGQEVHRFLSQLVAQPAQYVVVIDKKLPQLDAAVQALAIQPKIAEFRTFCREGVGLAVHIHQFEPLFATGHTDKDKTIEDIEVEKKKHIGVQVSDLMRVGLVEVSQKILAKHKGAAFEGKLLASGEIELSDGTVHKSLSGAAGHLTNSSIDGWRWWHTEFDGKQVLLDELREVYGRTPH